MADGPAEEAGSKVPFLFPEGVENPDFEIQLYIDDLDSGTGSLPLLLIAELETKILVAVPFEAWHRVSARRKMCQGALSKPAVVEVLAADASMHVALEEKHYIKCWVRFLRSDLAAHLQPLEEMTDCAINFGSYEGKFLIPAPESLIAAANEHFAFF
eukprot:s94_g88.t1